MDCATAPFAVTGWTPSKLGYELVRDKIGMRRESLKRQSGHDDNVVAVKTVQSA
jgi:hypothetical protein